MEVHLGRCLSAEETVDHIDGDCTNDALTNLQIISKEENAAKSVIRAERIKDICKFCNKEFELSIHQMTMHREAHHKDKAGPFCSRSCSGKYGAELQNGRIDKLDRPEYDIIYYRNQDSYDQKSSN